MSTRAGGGWSGRPSGNDAGAEAAPRALVEAGARADPVFATVAVDGKLRVLFVDDEPMLRNVVGVLLGSTHRVTTAKGGQEARALLEQGLAFDVLLCDVMMPGMSGIDLHAWLCAQNPLLARRTVFLTGGTFTARARDFLAGAGNLVLEKPFQEQELRAAISAAIERAPAP